MACCARFLVANGCIAIAAGQHACQLNAMRRTSTSIPRVEVGHQTGLESFWGGVFSGEHEMKTGPKADKPAESRVGKIEGKKLHYLIAGQGPTLILLHGYTQTSRMWRPLIEKLKDKFTVIAPDLPGIGDSDIPKDGSDMKTAAIRIHALAKSLGVTKARVVGHDIGLMVAYAYAAQFSAEVEKLVVMDAFLPGVPGWELAYNCGTLGFTARPRKRSSKDAKKSISRTSGTTWPLTKSAHSKSPTVTRMSQHIRVRAACVRAGPILPPGRTRPRISHKWPKQS
jgi:pimeloyl-ACP methyl ester carboxylesterase